MDNLDDSENNAKISDSAYSNSCSNSQSRRSHSSKSTHSGSHSSGSSGYGGKPPSGCSNNVGQQQKKEKDAKKKKLTPAVTFPTEKQAVIECMPPEPKSVVDVAPPKEIHDVVPPSPAEADTGQEVKMDVSAPDRSPKEEVPSVQQPSTSMYVGNRPSASTCSDGFSCVISMHDGVVMYTTSSLTSTLGFPKDMWMGRSFINFVHPRDRNTFASQITNGLAIPKIDNGTQKKAQSPCNSESTMVCRIREYRGLSTSFGVKDMKVNYLPFLLKLAFKNISDEDGKVIYLVIQATPFFSAFKISNEVLLKPALFVMRHAANGNLEYIDSESVPYLGYLPQDLINKDALKLYHPDDLEYLRNVYETIVKEGGMSRSKSFRMMTQNCDFIKVETEWSSFINPWSRKLEFVIGKHHIMEGPTDPDVFQNLASDKAVEFSDDVLSKAQALRESIVRIMNEVLTKPAEVAKQQMSKRCQDLASFMESLMEEPTKTEDELRLEIQDPDHSYYEPDSVMLGGISPHHEYSDSKSSVETPLSYTQLNYNETLHRYFDNHQPYSDDEYKTAAGENILGLQESKPVTGNCLSPMAGTSALSGNMTSSSDSNIVPAETQVGPIGDYPPVRLTESLLAKHNSVMEKKLMRNHREYRPSGKGERVRQKKMEHLARCNASFQPTMSHAPQEPQFLQPHGVKRPSKHVEPESGPNKHHCPNGRNVQGRRKPNNGTVTTPPPFTGNANNNQWPTNQVNNMNTFILGVGIPQQMSLMSPMPAMPGMFPMYYSPTSGPHGQQGPHGPNFPEGHNAERPNNQQHPYQMPQMPCMMYGQPMYGQPFMYPPMGPQVPFPLPQSAMGTNIQHPMTMTPLELTRSNYEESTEAVTDTNVSSDDKSKTDRLGNSEEQVDRTDAESSYSSFYSSFFKTESGSAEESSDAKKGDNKLGAKNKLRYWDKNRADGSSSSRSRYVFPHVEPRPMKGATRKMQPPWMEQVSMTSDLMFKYQVQTKSLNEVLAADKQKMSMLSQPNLVNDQLGQLYLDLRLEGETARLTLDEGITSSSSSGEETNSKTAKTPRRKREYSKLVMIYEEDAPLPPPSDTD